MNHVYIMDASSLIAFLNDEKGANKVDQLLIRASNGKCMVIMNKINVLEVFYGIL